MNSNWLVVGAVLAVLAMSTKVKNDGVLATQQRLMQAQPITVARALAIAVDELNQKHGCCVSVVQVFAVDQRDDTASTKFIVDVMLFYNTKILHEQRLQRLYILHDEKGTRITDVKNVSNVPLASYAQKKVIRKRWLLRNDARVGLTYVDRNDPLYPQHDTTYVQLPGESFEYKNVTPGHPQYGRVGAVNYDPRETYEMIESGPATEFAERLPDDSVPYTSEYPTDSLLAPAPTRITGADLDTSILSSFSAPPLSKLQHDLAHRQSILNMQYGT